MGKAFEDAEVTDEIDFVGPPSCANVEMAEENDQGE